MRWLRRINRSLVLLFFSLFAATALFAATSALAQGGPNFNPVPGTNEFDRTTVEYSRQGQYSLETFSLNNVGGVANSLRVMLVGLDDPETGVSLIPGAIPGVGNAIAYLYRERPAGTDMYLADLLRHAPFVEPAYAQGLGLGFQGLTPVLEIWKVFRDLTYVLFVFIFLIIGLMIMFRSKLNGGMVVTVEAAIPQLIVTLILITFSYAVAGLVVDIMYLSIYFIIGIFRDLLDVTAIGMQLEDIALSASIFTTGLSLIFGGNSVVSNAATAVTEIARGFFENNLNLGIINNWFSGILGVIGALVFGLAIFFAVVRTFFELLKSYVNFIFGVIFAPTFLIFGAFSGGSIFKEWFLGLLQALAPFPIVITMIFLALIFGGSGKNGAGWSAGSSTELTGGFSPPLVSIRTSGNDLAAFQALIAIGILMLMPEATKMAKEWFPAKNPLEKYASAIGEGLKRGWSGDSIAGIRLPGGKQILPTLAGTAATATAGGIGGAAYLGKRGWDWGKTPINGRQPGNVERVVRSLAGAGTGVVAGSIGGSIVGAAVPPVLKLSDSSKKAFKKVQDASHLIELYSENRKLKKAKERNYNKSIASSESAAQPD